MMLMAIELRRFARRGRGADEADEGQIRGNGNRCV